MTALYFSPAKLNLFLHITGKRDDGYHNLQSVFCRLDFGDTLLFDQHDGVDFFCLTGADDITAQPDDNLIIKAGKALLHHSQMHAIGTPTPTHITLNKRLPTGAGLGGGSSNAATTLMALNTRWQMHLDQQTLITIGKTLGADVPFFIFNQPSAIAEGIGDKLTAIDLPAYRYLLICPPVHNQTATFFANQTLTKDSPALDHQVLKQCIDDFLPRLHPPFFNAFEAIAKQSPPICHAFTYLNKIAVITQTTPRLTGTGSTVFLPIPPTIDQQTLADWQTNSPYPAFVAHSR